MKVSVAACLAGLALALLVVGAVSGTMLRHVVQILPILLALMLMYRRPALAAYAAIPVFVFWVGIVTLIWLFLLGLSRIANGHYTPVEILCTFVMAGCSLAGLVKAIAVGRPLSMIGRITVVVLFAVIQVGTMWISMLRPIANR